MTVIIRGNFVKHMYFNAVALVILVSNNKGDQNEKETNIQKVNHHITILRIRSGIFFNQKQRKNVPKSSNFQFWEVNSEYGID